MRGPTDLINVQSQNLEFLSVLLPRFCGVVGNKNQSFPLKFSLKYAIRHRKILQLMESKLNGKTEKKEGPLIGAYLGFQGRH